MFRNNTSKLAQFIYRHKVMWLIAFIVVGAGLDQWSKHWAQSTLARKITTQERQEVDGKVEFVPKEIFVSSQDIVVVPKVFSLIYKENPAAAFSLTHSWPEWIRRPLLIGVSILASIFFLIWYFRLREEDTLLMTAFGLILAGALGNFVDRVRFGYVVDFLDVHGAILGYPNLHWPTFNIADSVIVVGAIIVFLKAFKSEKKPTLI